MATTAATLILKVVADTKQAAAGVDNVASKTSSFKSKVSGAAKVAGAALIGLGAAAIHAGQAAAEDAQSQALLANSMQKNAGATKAGIAATEDWIAKQSLATGVADDELRPALATLVRSTGDVAKSQDALKVAMDVSAATGKDLTSVSAAMAKGFAGSTTSIGKLVPGISKAALESGNMTRVMGELADKTGGAMAKQAGTAAGQMDIMTNQMNEAEESIGAALLPVMAQLATMLTKVATFIQGNTKAFQIIIGVIAAVAAGIVVLNAVLKVYEAVTVAVGIAQKATWLANPVALVVIAVIALGVAIVVLYKKSKTFRDFVNKMWAGIKAGARVAASVFRAVWQAAVAAVKGYVQAWIAYFKLVFGVLRGVVKLVVALFKGDWKGALDAVKGILGSFRDFFKTLFGLLPDPVQKVIEKIRDGLGGAVQWLLDKIRPIGDILVKPWDLMTDAIGKVIDAIDDLIGWLGKIHLPDLGGFASKIGGIIGLSAPAPAMPGTVAARGVGGFAAPTVRRGVSSTAAGGGVNINVTGALDPEAVARQIQRILTNHNRRVGTVSAA